MKEKELTSQEDYEKAKAKNQKIFYRDIILPTGETIRKYFIYE